MKELSVAIVINNIAASGGTERVATFLANKFLSIGIKVALVSILKTGEPFYKLDKGIAIHYVDSASIIKLGAHIKRLNYDSVISISMGRLSFELAMLFMFFGIKSKLILSEHVGFETSNIFIRTMKLLSYRLADQLVLLTKHDYNIIRPLISTPVTVIHNATSYPTVDIDLLTKKINVVLAVGRLNQQKNFSKLLDLWSMLSDDVRQSWILKIVGNGEEDKLLKDKVSRLHISNSVVFSDASSNIHVEYQQASILAMTSRYEGLPLVLIEAKSFGLPAIAFDCKTGPSEIIANNEDGFLIHEEDDASYIKKLNQLMTNDFLRLQMGANAIKRSVFFSEDEVIKKWEDVL